MDEKREKITADMLFSDEPLSTGRSVPADFAAAERLFVDEPSEETEITEVAVEASGEPESEPGTVTQPEAPYEPEAEDVNEASAEKAEETAEEDVNVYNGRFFGKAKGEKEEETAAEKNTELAKEKQSRTRVFKKTGGRSEKEIPAEPEEDEVEKECRENRKEKVNSFKVFTSRLPSDIKEPEDNVANVLDLAKTEKGDDIFKVIEKTNKPRKDSAKRSETRKARDNKVYEKIDVGRVRIKLDEDSRSISIRKIAALVSFVLCLIFGTAKTLFLNGKLSFLSAIMGENPLPAYIIELVLGLPLLVISIKAFADAQKKSEKLTFCSEGMTALLMVLNTFHNALLVFLAPQMDKRVMFFGTAACFAVLIEAIGRGAENKMIKRNLEAIIRNDKLNGVFALETESEKLASGISKSKEPMVLCAGEVEIPDSFLDSSYTKDKENGFFNIMIPVSVVLSLACGVVAAFSYGSVTAFSSAALAAAMISAPLFLSPVLTNVIAKINMILNKTGCEILGYEAVENIDDADGIVLDTADLFIGTISHFHLISKDVKIDMMGAFEIAASILHASGGVLKSEIISLREEQKFPLHKVEDITYEEKLGISCWVDDTCVLLGTAEMMRQHNIDILPEYSGEKYEEEGYKVFYLAVDTHPTAMFCAEYKVGRNAKEQLISLYRTGAILMLMTTDPHIDEQYVAATLGVDASSIKTVSPVGAKRIREGIEQTSRQKRTGLIYKRSVIGLLKVINASFRLYDVQALIILIQIIGVAFGIVASMVLAVAGIGYIPGAIAIIAYHCVWLALGYFAANRNKN